MSTYLSPTHILTHIHLCSHASTHQSVRFNWVLSVYHWAGGSKQLQTQTVPGTLLKSVWFSDSHTWGALVICNLLILLTSTTVELLFYRTYSVCVCVHVCVCVGEPPFVNTRIVICSILSYSCCGMLASVYDNERPFKWPINSSVFNLSNVRVLTCESWNNSLLTTKHKKHKWFQ